MSLTTVMASQIPAIPSPRSLPDDSDECIRSLQRARLQLADIAMSNFASNLAAKASSRQKSALTAPMSLPSPSTPSTRPSRPKLVRRNASITLPLAQKPFGFSTIFDDANEEDGLDAGIVDSPPATQSVHEWKGRATANVNVSVESIASDDEDDDNDDTSTDNSPPAFQPVPEWKGRATANVNVVVESIASDDEDDDNDDSDLDSDNQSRRGSDEKVGASCVEFVEFVEDVQAALGMGTHPINAGVGADYVQRVIEQKVEALSKATVTVSEIPVAFRRHSRRGKRGTMACHNYHMLDTIDEMPSPVLPSSAFSFSSESSTSSRSSSIGVSNITITLTAPHEEHKEKRVRFPIVPPQVMVTPPTPPANEADPFARIFATAISA